MQKLIVTTSIGRPTNATRAFSQMTDWELIVVDAIIAPAHAQGSPPTDPAVDNNIE